MTVLENFVSPALTRALGWTLLHSLWQGALVAAVLAGALLLLRRQRAQVRYAAAAGALGGVVLLAGLTFGLYYRAETAPRQPLLLAAASAAARAGQLTTTPRPAAKAAATVGARQRPVTLRAGARPVPSPAATWLTTGLQYFDRHLPLLVVAWLLGLLAMSLRLLGGLLYVQRLRRYRVRPVGVVWQRRLAALAARGGVRRPVALLESALVGVPVAVGHLRPVLLLPLGAVAGLSVAHLEAILAHELAHVLRRDYLVNLLQTVAEALFFYHPAVWFMANCARTERENCCDDLATHLCGGDPLRLARALAALAEWSQGHQGAPTAPRLALAAIGGRGALLSRVRRLVGQRPAAPTLAEGLLAGALVLGGLGLLGSGVALAGPLSRPAGGPAVGAGLAQQPGQVPADTSKRPKAAAALPGVPPIPGPVPAAAPAPPPPPDVSDADAPPRFPTAPAGPAPSRPSTVVITKDRKGRLTGLTVDGQPVEAARANPSKADRRAGRQVTVVTVPPVPGPVTDEGVPRSSQERMRQLERRLSERAREFDRKMNRRMSKADAGDLRINIDEAAIDRLVTNALALGSVGVNLGLEAAAQGMEEARRSLRASLNDPGLSPRQRRATEQALDGLDRRPEERLRGRDEAARDRRQQLEERLRDTQRELRELDGPRRPGGREAEEALVGELIKDGLVEDPEHFQLTLTARGLVVNGKEQPAAVAQRYCRLYETRAGQPLSATGSVVMVRNSNTARRLGDGDRDGPTPPRPPRGPRPPRPALPAPPAAPRPPRGPAVDAQTLREQLRQDGVLGRDDKSFQFQLSNAGLTVNGQRQPDKLAAKYRKLTGHEGDKSFNITISTQE